jgi:hypothetical protein
MTRPAPTTTLILAMLGELGVTQASPAATPGPAATPAPIEATQDDPAADRHWASATALVQPAGSLQISNHMGLLVGVTAGLSESVQAFASLAVVGRDTALISGGAKIAFDHTGRWRAAGFARASLMTQRYIDRRVGELGAVVSYCAHASCRSLVSMSASIYGYHVTGNSDDGGGVQQLLLSGSAGVSHALDTSLKVTSEISLLRDPDQRPVLIGALSARYHRPRWMVEVTAVLAAERSTTWTDASVSVLPWLAAAYRWP